jgi:hypothetical protein
MSVFAPLKNALRVDLSGQRFGRLVVVRPLGTRNDKVRWLCVCDCGRDNIVATGSLRSGQIRSCGCLYVDSRGCSNRTHGQSKTPEYRVWKGMIGRCENPARDFYRRYGGRGISVCDRWRQSFQAFLSDMGQRPGARYSIERIDNDGPYAPENCRWATSEEQGQNTQRARRLTFNGETLSISGWARRLRMSTATIRRRLAAKLPLPEVLRTHQRR